MEPTAVFSGKVDGDEAPCHLTGITTLVDGVGVMIADHGANRIKKITFDGSYNNSSGITVHCKYDFPYKIVADTTRNIPKKTGEKEENRYIIMVRENENTTEGRIRAMTPSGLVRVNLQRNLRSPVGLTVDPQGRVVFLCQSPYSTVFIENTDYRTFTSTLTSPVLKPVGLVAAQEQIFICDAADSMMKVYVYCGLFKRMFKLRMQNPFAIRLNSDLKIVVGGHTKGDPEGTLKVYELNGTLLNKLNFKTGPGQCLDLECFGSIAAKSLYISSSDGMIRTYQYSSLGDWESRMEPDSPPPTLPPTPSQTPSQTPPPTPSPIPPPTPLTQSQTQSQTPSPTESPIPPPTPSPTPPTTPSPIPPATPSSLPEKRE